jgi:hypothetical protein
VRDEGHYEGFEGANRKAISLVVATVVLVLISVIASAILWFWVSNFTSASTAQQPALNERIKIEAVEVSGNDVKVYVRNVGSVATTIHYVYVLKPDGTLLKAQSVSVPLSPGRSAPAQVTGVSGASGHPYTVKVVTEHGVEALYTFVWPVAIAKAVAMPTTRDATTTKSYPQSLTSTELGYDLVRISRGAVQGKLWTDFESMPSGWTQNGGSWGIVDGGFKGEALRGSDDDEGLGGASHFYNNTDLSGYTSLWASVKAKLDNGTGYYGISMRDRDSKRLYTIEIHRISDKKGSVEVWSYNVETSGWYTLGSAGIANYDQGNWYVIVVNYVVDTNAVSFSVWVYDANGNQVASLSARSTSPNRFAPAYIGFEVDGPGMRALFDDFIASTVDPRVVNFIDLPGAGYTICIYDDFGALVNCSTSTGSSASVGVVKDVVVGTGVDGRIVVKDPSGGIVVDYRVPQSDAMLGGDAYKLVTRFGASLVDLASFANCIKLFNANLSLYVTANATVTLKVLVNGTSVYSGTNQTFDVFVPIPSELLGRVNTYEMTLLLNSTSPFEATVQRLRVTGLGLFED